MKQIIPKKLQKGDFVRVIAPSRSLGIISQETRNIAHRRFQELDLNVSFGKHVEEMDEFSSSTIQSRIEDLHEAFQDSKVKAIITIIGGFNSNQLLHLINWSLIEKNPKIFCGYSDITILNNSLFAKAGLVSYSGPHYSTFGQKLHFDYTLEYFKKCLFSTEPFEIESSETWSDDRWFSNQEDRNLIPSEGFHLINEGEVEGVILGANLCTFNLLQGTEYFPALDNSILFLEDDCTSLPHTFDRDLQSLIYLPDFSKVKGLVIGRFQKATNMTREKLTKIIKTKKELKSIPVIADVDFGHTDPKITFPIGGTVQLKVSQRVGSIKILEH